MTLAEALQRLHEAGRIRSPWLPGMSAKDADPGQAYFRIVAGNGGDGSFVWGYYRRIVAGNGGDGSFVWGYYRYDHAVRPFHTEEMYDNTPDLTDPATLGCLLALVREASGDPLAHLFPDGDEWACILPGKTPAAWCPTEGAALSAALIALAEGL
jgi:hypothetical protein